MNKKLKYILIIIILAVVIIFASYKWGSDKQNLNNIVPNQNLINENTLINENIEKKSDKINIFRSSDSSFSFEYLSNYKLSQLTDDVSESILIQENGRGLQIYITDFTANMVFNAKLVKQELVGEKINNLKDVNMPGGFPAVSFSSTDPSLGDTFEIWFVKAGKLYQITAEVNHQTLLQTLIDSWKFN